MATHPRLAVKPFLFAASGRRWVSESMPAKACLEISRGTTVSCQICKLTSAGKPPVAGPKPIAVERRILTRASAGRCIAGSRAPTSLTDGQG